MLRLTRRHAAALLWRPWDTPHVRGYVTYRRIVSVVFVLLAAMAGCSPPPAASPSAPASRLPRLDDPRFQQRTVPPEGESAAGAPVTIRVSRMALPLQANMEPAWAAADTTMIDPSILDAWHANGIRIGILPPDQIQGFLGQLPAPVQAARQQVVSTERRAVIETTPPLEEPLLLQTVIDGRTRSEMIRLGQFQFLLRLSELAATQADLAVVPHHHFPKASVVPRPIVEQMFDGRSFERLAMPVRMPRDHVLVIGLTMLERMTDADETPVSSPGDRGKDTRPGDAAAEQSGVEKNGDRAREGEAPGEAMVEAPPDPARSGGRSTQRVVLPPHLGRLMLVTTRYDKPVQLILLVGLPGG